MRLPGVRRALDRLASLIRVANDNGGRAGSFATDRRGSAFARTNLHGQSQLVLPREYEFRQGGIRRRHLAPCVLVQKETVEREVTSASRQRQYAGQEDRDDAVPGDRL